MNWTKIKQAIAPSSCIGLELILDDERDLVNIIKLKKKKGQLHIEYKWEGIDDLNRLTSIVDSHTPVHLTICGAGILHKSVPGGLEDQEEMLEAVLPNAAIQDFYIQQVPLGSGGLVSIIRQEKLDAILELLQSKGCAILGLYLGAFNVRHLHGLIGGTPTIITQTQVIRLDNKGQVIAYSQNESDETIDDLKIGTDKISYQSTVAFSGALTYLLGMPSGAHLSSIKKAAEDFFYTYLFNKGIRIAGIVIGGTLILNTAAYFHYKEKSNSLQAHYYQNKTEIEQLDDLKSAYTRQQNLLDATNLHLQSQVSFYADELGRSRVEGIQWSDLEVFPQIGKSVSYDKNELIQFDNDAIRIKGTCQTSQAYNMWIAQLETLSWVNQIEHLAYRDTGRKAGYFDIRIAIRGE